MTGSRRGAASAGGAPERRAKYAELRRQGISQWDAARAVGIDPHLTSKSYERWYQAAGAGQVTSFDAHRRAPAARVSLDHGALVDGLVHDHVAEEGLPS